jgi:hypothetical protein
MGGDTGCLLWYNIGTNKPAHGRHGRGEQAVGDKSPKNREKRKPKKKDAKKKVVEPTKK